MNIELDIKNLDNLDSYTQSDECREMVSRCGVSLAIRVYHEDKALVGEDCIEFMRVRLKEEISQAIQAPQTIKTNDDTKCVPEIENAATILAMKWIDENHRPRSWVNGGHYCANAIYLRRQP